MRKGILCLPLAAALCLLAGCARLLTSREAEQLQLVQTMGFDAASPGVIVSVSSGRALGDTPTARIAARGDSIPEAVQSLQDWSAHEELFFAHTRYALIGEAMAKEGVEGILDYFERGTQTRLDLPLFVVRGAEARSLVTGSEDGEYEITALLSSLQREVEKLGTVHCFSLLDTAERLARSGTALCCALIGAEPGENAPSAGDGALAALAVGYAVLKDGALVGWLDSDAALGTDLLLGFSGSKTAVLPVGHGGTVTAEIRECRAELTPVWDDSGALTALWEVSCRAGIVGSDGCDPRAPGMEETLDRELSHWVGERIEKALDASQTLDADFTEVYRRLRRSAPEAFPRTAPGDFLRTLRQEVRLSAAVERSYDIGGTADTRGKGARP